MEPFSYELPAERIAQRPAQPPDAARLLCVERAGGGISEYTFADLPRLLRPGDLIVFNNTGVIPARLFGTMPNGGPEVELLLLRRVDGAVWDALGRPLRKLVSQSLITFGEELSARVLERLGEYEIRVEFSARPGAGEVEVLLQGKGIMPIPPYIRSGRADEQDRIDYQTPFAEVTGSVAAPTASLHFTPNLLSALRGAGVEMAFVTLHLGTASFLPLHSGRAPGAEVFAVPQAVRERIRSCRREGGRVIAVGTSVVRALESSTERPDAGWGSTSLFIQPGYTFGCIDGIVTNFHQPATTHLQLVEAFMGRRLTEESYQHALSQGFRFLSYGDGMFVC